MLGGSAECAGLLDFVRSCQNLTEFDFPVSSRPAPLIGGGGFNRSAHSAEPTPNARGLVHWFFGVLAVGVCIAIQNRAVTKLEGSKELPESLQSGPLEVFLWS